MAKGKVIGNRPNSTLKVYAYEPKPRKKIANRSNKRASQERDYSKLRVVFLTENSDCQAQLDGCAGEATEVHHKKGRIGSLLTDTAYFLAVCRYCHDWIENNPIKAKQLNLSLNRL